MASAVTLVTRTPIQLRFLELPNPPKIICKQWIVLYNCILLLLLSTVGVQTESLLHDIHVIVEELSQLIEGDHGSETAARAEMIETINCQR